MKHKAEFAAICLLVAALTSGGYSQVSHERTHSQAGRVDRAIQRGVEFLLSQITEEGSVESEPRSGSRQYGGETAITVYALLAAKVDPKTPQLARAIRWVTNTELVSTYAVALRACAMAEWKDSKALGILKRDLKWLIRAHGADGAYWYVSQAGGDDGIFDNSNTQMAVLGVWAAAQRGLHVPKEYWRKIEAHWVRQQLPDGGWNYRLLDRRRRRITKRSYGSMTVAGLASLFITYDVLHRTDHVRTTATIEYKPLANGFKWLAENFTVQTNPKLGGHWYYWLYSLERVGLASGYKYFGGHNWYAEGARELISAQADNGSWGFRSVSDTAFAILFLVRGRYPVLVNKLRYSGRWNPRPRDMANLVRWLSWNFERPVSWQVVDIDSALSDWHDAPILYISGAGPVQFSEKEIAKLRTFALQGGMILSEAAGNNGDFTLDIQKAYKQMFPDLPLRRLDDENPIYNMYFTPKGPGGLSGISNGVRWLVIHSPRELSLALQIGGQDPENKPWFELLSNIYLLGTDKGILTPRGTTHWPRATFFEPAATIRLTRVKYEGNYDPEPAAWDRLGTIMGNRYRLKLRISDPVEVAKLNAASHPLAVMTGTDAFRLRPDEIRALKRYFDDGGTLIIDAAGGKHLFDQAVRKQILRLPENAAYGPLPRDHPIYRWPELIEKVTYRRDFALALGEARHQPRLRGVLSNGRLAVVYSRDDLTGALVGYQFHGIRGYTPRTAAALMANVVCYAARLSPQAIVAPKTRPIRQTTPTIQP